MKKRAILLALAVATVLTACGSNAAAKYTKGTTTDTTYESEWIGFRFTAPEGTTMATEEEINETMGMGQDFLDEDFSELQLKYAEMTTVTEMMCSAPAGAPNVGITTEKLAVSMKVDKYIDAFEDTLAQVTSMTYTVLNDADTVKVGGQDFRLVSTKAEYMGQELFQDYYITVKGNRAVAIVMTYTEDTATEAETMMNAFAAY